MADFEDQKSSDGWVGDPDMLLAQHPRRGRFVGFHSFNLTRRIFLANFIALAVLLVGALLVSQPQNQFSKTAKEYLSNQADFQQAVFQHRLDQTIDGTPLELLEDLNSPVLRHNGLSLKIYDQNMNLVSEDALELAAPHDEGFPVEEGTVTLWKNLSRIFGSGSPRFRGRES